MCSRSSSLFLCRYKKDLSLKKAFVSTWSPLGVTFNTLPNIKLTPGVEKQRKGLFGVEALTSPEGFFAIRDEAYKHTRRLLAEAKNPDRSRKIVDVFDDLSDELCKVADLSEFIRLAHPDEKYQLASEKASMHINNIVEILNTHAELYNALKRVSEFGDKVPTTDVDDYVAKLFLLDFDQSGIHLPEEERKHVIGLNDKILNLCQLFTAGAAEPRKVPKSYVPEGIRQHFSNIGDDVIVQGLCNDSPNELVREYAYKIYLSPDPSQEKTLEDLLSSRDELARICGFPSYAHRALNGTIAGSPDFVREFLEKLNRELRPKVEDELRYLLKLKKSHPHITEELNPYDIIYYTIKARSYYQNVDLREINAYLPLGACMEGFSNLSKKLFGISLVCEELHPQEVWSPDVYKLAVIHESEGLLGHIYCDFYQRDGKPNQDCHFMIRGGRELTDGSYQNPIVVALLNLPVPQWSSPCLLTLTHLDNLVHEMGHALHSMLARTKHHHVTGTRCCTDFAEVPSILMEYFISDPRVFKTFTKHFQTKEPMSDEIIRKICNSKHILNATEAHMQVIYSALDQRLHGKHPLGSSTGDIYLNLQQELSLVKPVKDTAWQLRFSHLVGYGAKYYSYLLSKSIASSIWRTYFVTDPFSREMGERYRQECLRHGGGKPPRQLINDFLNKEASPLTMADALVAEIDRYQNLLYKQ